MLASIYLKLKDMCQLRLYCDACVSPIDDEEDDYERYGLYFQEPIGYIIRTDGSQTPLYYGEIKIVKTTGKYHAIPRTKPRRTS